MAGITTGVSRYLRSLYGAMAALPDVRCGYVLEGKVLAAPPQEAEPGPWMRRTARIWSLPDPAVFGLRCGHWLLYEAKLRRLLARERPDLHHETGFTPAAAKTVPQVFTLHDLSLITWAHTHPKERVWFFKTMFPRRLRYARMVITPSEFVRQEAVQQLGLEPERVVAVPEAPDPLFGPRTEQQIAETLERLQLPSEYILFVGTLEPRKNIDLLMRALPLTRTDVPVVLAGWEGWGEKPWRKLARKLGVENRLRVTGYVDNETLARLYAGAQALAYPSLYEGFGLPVLEAMACGAPVICARAGSLPEVAGDAAMLVDPSSPDELAGCIDTVLDDSTLRGRLRGAGAARAAEFTWDMAARRTLDIFRSAANA